MTKVENYSWNAEDYAKHSSGQYEWAKELIPKLKLAADESVLDIGCGDGKITAVLAALVPRGQVIGVDNSEEMISLARHTFTPSNYPNLAFIKMDARKLTFEEQFNVAFSNATLHWVIDHRPLLSGVERSLRKPGRLLFQMGGKGNAQQVLTVLDEMLKEERWSPFFNNFEFPYGFYGPEEYEKLLIEAGLKPERAELLPKKMKLQGKEELLGWIRTCWMPYTQKLPDELRAPFMTELADRYLEKHPLDGTGIAHLKMARLEVQANKT